MPGLCTWSDWLMRRDWGISIIDLMGMGLLMRDPLCAYFDLSWSPFSQGAFAFCVLPLPLVSFCYRVWQLLWPPSFVFVFVPKRFWPREGRISADYGSPLKDKLILSIQRPKYDNVFYCSSFGTYHKETSTFAKYKFDFRILTRTSEEKQ